MPWCAGCDRFLNPNTLRPDGTCPQCQRMVADPGDAPAGAGTGDVAVDVKAPWHFKLLVVMTVVYLVWRFGAMLGWIAG